MKLKSIYFTILFIFPIILFAQKEDYQWIMGYEAYNQVENFGTTILDFNADTLEVSQGYSDMNFSQANASMCDESGKLLFYTNGIYVANHLHEPLINGRGLNPNDFTYDFADIGLPLAQGAMIIKKPLSDNQYYLFHGAIDFPDEPSTTVSIHVSELYYSLVDPFYQLAGRQRGRVIEKNVILRQDTLTLDNLTGVRHANGRDWWIFIGEYRTNVYYRFLLTPNGVEEYTPQQVGIDPVGGAGQAVFSPDGSRYVRYNQRYIDDGGHISIYDFDRCSGELSNHQRINIKDEASFGGAAISPNSRFLYISSMDYVYQYDLNAVDIIATKDTVAIYDGFYTTHPLFTTRFYMAQLAPDGKIYINSPGGKDYLHVIHQPDSLGQACRLEQHGIKLPTYNSASLPHFPNYRLGALANSPCDTIRETTNTIQLKDQFQISTYPNPVQTQLTVDLTLPSYAKLQAFRLELRNAYGQLIERRQLREYTPIYRFEVADLPRGVYFVNLYQEQKIVAVQRIVVQ